MDNILTSEQKRALSLIAKTPLASCFYFSGGTALAHFYLQHRRSEDLDFFSKTEFDPQEVTVIIKSIQEKLGFLSFDYQTSFNRNLYFLRFPDNYVLKLEFTYYPFVQIEKPQVHGGLEIDSLIDIATNKLFTISQKARGRDFFDLFHIIQKKKYTLDELRKKAKIKFDWHVDPLQLGSQLYAVDQYLDDPLVEQDVTLDIVSFFQTEAKKFQSDIIISDESRSS